MIILLFKKNKNLIPYSETSFCGVYDFLGCENSAFGGKNNLAFESEIIHQKVITTIA